MDQTPKPQPLDYRRPPAERLIPEDPQARVWRYRRLFFRIGLFVLFTPFIFYFGPNLINFGKLTGLAPADFVPEVQRYAVPEVRAIKEYQRDTGHFPSSMSDLEPKYHRELFGRGDIDNSGKYYCFGKYGQLITYDFTPGSEGWSVEGSLTSGRIPLPPVTIGPATQP
jgi:hypothetical protein